MGMLAVLCVADYAKRERWRTIGLWSVGGPDLYLRLREGFGITQQALTFGKCCFAIRL